MALLWDGLSQTKLLASVILFVITLLCGYLPVRVIVNQSHIQYAMYAGGGVLMATAFCHLIPETHDNFRTVMGLSGGHSHSHNHNHAAASEPIAVVVSAASNNNQTTLGQILASNNTSSNATTAMMHNDADAEHDVDDLIGQMSHFQLPYIEMMLCCGFFFMYLVEMLMVRFINNHTHEHPCDDGGGPASATMDAPQSTTGSLKSKQHARHSQAMASSGAIAGDDDLSYRVRAISVRQHDDNEFSVGAKPPLLREAHSVDSLASSARQGSFVGDSRAHLAATVHTHNHDELDDDDHNNNNNSRATHNASTHFYKFLRGLLIVSAFSVHSIFDGVAIGSQDSVDKVWTIFAAISCHKLIIAAVVGLELFAATLRSHFWTLVHLSVFSVMSPIGIILVVVAQNSLQISSDHPAMILLQSFATGTLLYIVFVEILQPKEGHKHEQNRWLGRFLSLIIGFTAMLFVLVYFES